LLLDRAAFFRAMLQNKHSQMSYQRLPVDLPIGGG
jgi:hypothetical protein